MITCIGLLLITLGSIVIVVLSFLVIKKHVRTFSLRVRSEALDREAVLRSLENIEGLLKAPTEMARKVAVREADKLLDYVLKMYGVEGATMSERMQNVARLHRDLREVVRVRGRVVKEAEDAMGRLSESEAAEAVHRYKRALRALNAL